MSRFLKLLKRSVKNRTLIYDAIAMTMSIAGYGDSNLAGKISRYKCYLKLKKQYARKIGKTDFEKFNDDMSDTVWICWLQGMENAPELVKNCVDSVNYHIKDRNIIIITAENFSEYAKLPNFIIEKWQKGIMSNTHFSDILRLALLIQRGGLWLDATVYLTGPLPDYITENDFFVYHDGEFECDLINMGNWLIYSKPNNILLNETYRLLLLYWETHNYCVNYFIFHLFFRMVSDHYPDEWHKVPYYSHYDQHIFAFDFYKTYNARRFEQIRSLTSVHKLTNKTQELDFEENSYYSKLGELYKKETENLK